MQSALFNSATSHWLVVGSNGLIGSDIATALHRSSLLTASPPLLLNDYDPSQYVRANLEFLNGIPLQGLRILFCAGRGGFSIGNEIAEHQIGQWQAFCQQLKDTRLPVEKIIFISSLGCACSELTCPYTHLVQAQEAFLLDTWNEQALIIRLPSMYGYNRSKMKYGGLIGVMMQNLKLRRSTSIYARMETRRNYLSSQRMASTLFADANLHHLCRQGILNIQASLSMTIYDVCSMMFQATRKRPCITLQKQRVIDSESHFPSTLKDAKLVINDNLKSWIRQEWIKSVPKYR